MEEERCMEEERRALLLALLVGSPLGEQSRQLGAGEGAPRALCAVQGGTWEGLAWGWVGWGSGIHKDPMALWYRSMAVLSFFGAFTRQ